MMSGSAPSSGHGYQPPPGMQSTTTPRKLRPGRIWYLVSLLLFAAAVAWLVLGIASTVHAVNSLQRVPLPAGGTISLSHSGSYVVYYEGPGAQGGHLQGFNVNVSPASPGAVAKSLTPYQASVTYSLSGHQGRAVLTLKVTHPGRFRVTPSKVPPADASGDLAFGQSIAGGIVRAVAVGVPVMGLAFIGGLTVFIIRIARKSRIRRARQYPGPQYPGQQYPAQQGQQYPAQQGQQYPGQQ
jgi:hypothetical protein